MSIRYYLLLIAGFITSCVFIGTFFLDDALLSRGLKEAHTKGETVTKQLFENKRQYLQQFILEETAKDLAQINSLLEAISKFQPLAQWFASTPEHEQKGTWGNAASLIQQDEWIEFLQNTSGKKVLSALVPSKGPFFSTEAIAIREGLSWVYVKGAAEHPEPFLGIEVPIKMQESDIDEVGALLTSGIIPTVYVLYDWHRFKALSFPIESEEDFFLHTPLAGGVEIDESKFLGYLSFARAMAQETDVIVPSPLQGSAFPSKPVEAQNEDFNKSMQRLLIAREKYASELFLICQAAILQQIGFFGEDAKGQQWPDAMTFSTGPHDGETFFIKSVMDFSEPIFDDEAFFLKAPKTPGSHVSCHSHIVKSPQENQAFLVNTAAVYWGEEPEQKQSLLTLGIGLQELLNDVVSSAHHYGVIVHDGKVLVNLAPEGKPSVSSGDIEAVLGKLVGNTGLITVDGIDYWFSIARPIPDLDLSFIFFDLKEEAFGLLYGFQANVKSILDRMGMQRQILEVMSLIVLWALLLRISKKITEPIVNLSSSLQYVKKGEWDLIRLPSIRFSKKNEIRQLYDSFHDMVEGMKEKEKVTAILNKVVSEEIAEEILKGGVQLGGEERVVTMLFADIRGFTHLTQNMPPHEVIEFLNMCMTKLSLAVEKNKGVIDKYMGDGLMALYGAPISYPQSPLHAILSALEMIFVLKQWNEERLKENKPPIFVGIGIHTGSVCVGNMGAQNRLNYTVIGSSVNRASRLCSYAGAEEILISQDTYLQEGIKEKIQVEDRGMMTIKGFDEKIQAFKVIGIKKL